MDGRDTFNDADLDRAAAELGGQESRSIDSLRSANETNLGEQLTQHGLNEADHDQRVAASESDES